MYVVASFEQSRFLELAITELEERGIHRQCILAVPLEQRGQTRNILDSIHQADGISLTDGAAILGTACMVLGTIYGFILPWGPIIWALLGLAGGIGVGFGLDFALGKRMKRGSNQKPNTDIVLLIRCEHQHQIDIVKQILWDHYASGLASIS